jgi:Fur family ferric uptake transcriptional regulator
VILVPHGPPWYHGKIRKSGYRLTFPRQKILEVLSKSTEHLSAEEIFNKVQKRRPSIGLTTVYRTLELLMDAGLIAKYDFGDGKRRYELINGPGTSSSHHHLICNNCRKMINYSEVAQKEKKLIEEIGKELSEKYNFDIQSYQIQFYGLCQKCKKRRRSNKK